MPHPPAPFGSQFITIRLPKRRPDLDFTLLPPGLSESGAKKSCPGHEKFKIFYATVIISHRLCTTAINSEFNPLSAGYCSLPICLPINLRVETWHGSVRIHKSATTASISLPLQKRKEEIAGNKNHLILNYYYISAYDH